MRTKRLSKDQQVATARALADTLQHFSILNPHMTLGRVMTYLAVATYNTGSERGEGLPRQELYAIAGGEAVFGRPNNFNAGIAELAGDAYRLRFPSSAPRYGLVESHPWARDDRYEIATLSAKGNQLLNNITTNLVADIAKVGRK